MKKLHTSLCHPQINGQCERLISILIGMLGTLPENSKSTWRDHISTLVHTYNTAHTVMLTEFSLYYLMFGRKPRISINLYYGPNTADLHTSKSTKFVQQLERRLCWAYQKACEVNEYEDINIKMTGELDVQGHLTPLCK